jgi:hypothetical protein
MTGTDPRAAYTAWTEHRFFAYRGCAPDPDDPRRAAGNPALSLDAWHGPDRDGAEPQRERRAREEAAKEVCAACPVRVQCDAYANSVTADGKLVEPDGILGGRTGRERRDAFTRKRHQVAAATPTQQIRTPQKEAVLLALAMCTDPLAVARAAGVDLRTANWQRSRLVTQLNLEKASATRRELLAEAVRRGLVDGAVVVDDDGTVPAVPPAVSSTSPAVPAPAAVPVPAAAPAPVAEPVRPGGRRPRRATSRRERSIVPSMPGQLSFDDALAPVTALYSAQSTNRRLEAAA